MDDTWPRVVVFYNPEQEASLVFQPTFIQLARKLRHDSQNIPVLFHAINCVVHFEVCTNPDFHIRVFPSLWVFTEGGVAGGKAIDASVHYEDLLIQVANVVGVTLKARRKKNKVGFLHEDDTSIDSNNDPLTNDEEGRTKRFHSSGSDKTPPGGNGRDIASGMANDNDLPSSMSITESNYSRDKINEMKGVGGRTPLKRDQNLDRIFRDAQKSFYQTLKHNIYPPDGKETPLYLPPKKQEILFDFLDLLHWALPSSWIIHDVINDLRNDFSTAIKGRQSLLLILNRHDAVHGDWSDECRLDDSLNMKEDQMHLVEFIGYSCGLWNLFHILSVGTAESHKFVMGDRERVTPSYTAWVIQDFVDSFVIDPSEDGIIPLSVMTRKQIGNIPWCLNCKSKLLKSYETCMYGLCSLEFESTNFDTKVNSQTWNVIAEWIWYTKGCVYISSFKSMAINVPSDKTYDHIHRLFWPLGPQNPRIPILKKFLRSDSSRLARRQEQKNALKLWSLSLFGLLVSLITFYHYFKRSGKRMKRIQKLGKSV